MLHLKFLRVTIALLSRYYHILSLKHRLNAPPWVSIAPKWHHVLNSHVQSNSPNTPDWTHRNSDSLREPTKKQVLRQLRQGTSYTLECRDGLQTFDNHLNGTSHHFEMKFHHSVTVLWFKGQEFELFGLRFFIGGNGLIERFDCFQRNGIMICAFWIRFPSGI